MDALKDKVCEANLAIVRAGLVFQTWGNASAIDRESGRVCIKPSGVDYEAMTAEDMVIVDLDGVPENGALKPSVDLPTHLALYQAFPAIGGIVHTHSHFATCFAQACTGIPCLGTTHADYFDGDVPVTDELMPKEVAADYEANIGNAIVRAYQKHDPMHAPAVLVANHGPFAWGETIERAVENAAVLEEVARLAFHTLTLSPTQGRLSSHLAEKHFFRKHGQSAYYGQKNT